MTANELRIGNWVKDFNGKPYEITPRFFCSVSGGLTWDEQVQAGHSELNYTVNPIPLTPEILEKAGFVESEEDWLSLVLYNGITIYYNLAYRQISIVSSTDEWQQGSILEQIKSLHQLQNLCFDLSGEELTVNL